MTSRAASRAEIRRKIRARRRALSTRERRHAALDLARTAAVTALFRNARHIAFYFPNDGELDPTPLLHRAWDMNKKCYLPVLDQLTSDRLWFSLYRYGDPLVVNRFGIPEPEAGIRNRVRARRLDLVLTPLVAFDVEGNRLGMGGGFYDRTLSFLKHRLRWHRPRLYGVAYEFQKIDRLEPAPWDVPLAGVLTERRLYRICGGGNPSDRKGRKQ